MILNRLPIRAKLTIAFAIATAVVLALAATFVYLRISQDLNDAIDEGLITRTDLLRAEIAKQPPAALELGRGEDPEDSFSQIIDSRGVVVNSSSPGLEGPVPGAPPVATASNDQVGTDVGQVPGVDGDARLLARPADHQGEQYVVIAGVSTQDRDDTLSALIKTFLIAAPLALLIASAAGYGLATVAMRPVERMRRQAGAITLSQTGERLPLGASHDEIHRLGETLNEMLARIEESLERERSFIADASHELRTPLAVLRSELELGLRPDRDLLETRAAMLSAEEEVRRLQRLTDDLLAMARSDDVRLPIERSTVSVPELLETVRARFAPRAEAADRRLEIGFAAPATAELDPARIEAALANLVENSLRHGEGRILVASRADGSAAVFEVTDEGKGFPEGFAASAFERFARAESGRTTAGHGLGLAIVKAVAEAHGGSVEIDPTAFGARVVMRIPAGPPAGGAV